jgi:hypothetical protein
MNLDQTEHWRKHHISLDSVSFTLLTALFRSFKSIGKLKIHHISILSSKFLSHRFDCPRFHLVCGWSFHRIIPRTRSVQCSQCSHCNRGGGWTGTFHCFCGGTQNILEKKNFGWRSIGFCDSLSLSGVDLFINVREKFDTAPAVEKWAWLYKC